MTAPPPDRAQPWRQPPHRPPLPVPISLGMIPIDLRLSEGAAINCSFYMLNPVLATSLISIELNGYELVPARWGRIEIPVRPGTYHFRVFIRNGQQIKHLAEVTADVVPGQLLELDYVFPRFGKPFLSVSATAEENKRMLWLMLGSVLVLWVLLLVWVFI